MPSSPRVCIRSSVQSHEANTLPTITPRSLNTPRRTTTGAAALLACTTIVPLDAVARLTALPLRRLVPILTR